MEKPVEIDDVKYDLIKILNNLQCNTELRQQEEDHREVVKFLLIFLLFRYLIACNLVLHHSETIHVIYILYTISLAALVS